MSSAEFELSDAIPFGRDQETWLRDGFDKVYELSWLNVFGPKLVETWAASACSPRRPTGWRSCPTAPSSW